MEEDEGMEGSPQPIGSVLIQPTQRILETHILVWNTLYIRESTYKTSNFQSDKILSCE